MLPVSLKFKGIFSYKNEVSIDFKKLTRNYLFGIFGRTGSGKSTILEAMMYALYGDVARLDNTKLTYNLMNSSESTTEFYIDFIFEHKCETYRCMVSAKRKKKNFEETNTPEFRYFKKENNAWQPIQAFDAKDILGLKASHFKKTVIIPQNEFQEFIQMSSTDRVRMIKDIFVDLEKFDLEQKTKKLLEACHDDLIVVREKIKNVEAFTPETLFQISENLKHVDVERANYSNQKKEIEKKIETILEIEKLHFAKKNLLIAREKLIAQLPTIEILKTNVAHFEYFKTHLETLFVLHKNSFENFENTKNSISKKNLERESLLKNVEKINAQRAQYENIFLRRAEIEKEIAALKLFETVRAIESQLAPLQKLSESFGEQFGEITAEKRKTEVELQTLNDNYNALLNTVHDIVKLTNLNNWYHRHEELESSYKKIDTRIQKIDAELDALQTEKNKIVKSNFSYLQLPINTSVKMREAIELVKNRALEINKEREEIEIRTAHINSFEKFRDAAQNLVDGAPCPLCGALHHPNVFNDADAQFNLKELKKLDDANKQFLDRCRAVEVELEQLIRPVSTFQKEKMELGKELTEYAAQLAAHSNAFVFGEFDRNDKTKLILAFDEANAHTQKLQSAQKTITLRTAQIEKLIQKADAATAQKQKTDLEIATLISKKEEIASRIAANDLKKWRSLDSVALQNTLQNQTKILNTAINVFESSEKSLVELNNALLSSAGSIEELEKQVKQQTESHGALEQKLQTALQSAPLISRDAWINFEKQTFDIAKARVDLNDFTNNQTRNASELQKIETELNGKVFLEEEKNNLYATLQTVEQNIENAISEKAKLQASQKLTEENIQIKTEALQQRDALEFRSENLKKLQQLFSKSGFVNYVSTVYLVDLCRRTNARFKPFTYNRLQIEIDANNNFVVKDNMNGGVMRSIKTLSGGQLFQVSLSLALALAENIQTLYGTEQNFFFLDEGFGSLDTESLEMVFQFLKALQRENRIIGVISHVESMQQEIENYLLVTLDDENGSAIEAHY